MKNNYSKIFAFLLIIAIIGNIFILPKKTAIAAFGFGDIVSDPWHTAETSAGWLWDQAKWIEQKTNYTLRDTIAKQLMDYIVDQTVEWIQGGGEPKFIGNWGELLNQAGDIAFQEVVNELGVAGLCSPFGLQVRLALLPVNKFSKRIECTLEDVVTNIDNFYVDFSVGGWNGYLVSFEPQNNFYGQVIMAYDEVAKRAQENKEAAKSEGIASGGFLASTKCSGSNTYSYNTVSSTMSKEDFDNTMGSNSNYSKDSDGNYCAKSDIKNVTPGSLVGNAAVEATVGSDSKWAANIQSWTSALVNAAINRLISEGLSSMTSSDSSSDSYYPEDYQDLADAEAEQTQSDLTDSIQEIMDEWETILSYKNSSLSYLTQIVSDLNEMKIKGCSTTDEEISTASSNLSSIQSEVDDLNAKISEGNDIIDEINSADTTEALTDAQYRLSSFTSQYNTSEMQLQIISGEERDAAKEESEGFYNQLYGSTTTSSDGTEVTVAGTQSRLAYCAAILIDGGAASAQSTSVTLTINSGVSEVTGLYNTIYQMMVSNDSSFSGISWETYTNSKSWTLSSGNGTKYVFVKFRDISGYSSNTVYDTIELSQ